LRIKDRLASDRKKSPKRGREKKEKEKEGRKQKQKQEQEQEQGQKEKEALPPKPWRRQEENQV